MTGIHEDSSPPSVMPGSSPPIPSPSPEEDRETIIRRLEELEPQLSSLTEIVDIFYDTPLICMRDQTYMQLCYRLDPRSDIQAESSLTKDFHGIAEWANLEPVFIKYVSQTESKYKTTDVLAKWSTSEIDPPPTLGNLQRCLCGDGGIDRPDVITDLAAMINIDAFKWTMQKYRANTTQPEERDDSWQLTRQDMIVRKPTYYTCCLVYADEDEGTAAMITKLFQTVYPLAMFFNPQFDLKRGKYVHDTTAQVIEERCKGKVIFIISEYFFASPVCQFTVNFARELDMSAERGNLIPFSLVDKLPRVLRGITGIKWFGRHSRKRAWLHLSQALFASKLNVDQIKDLEQRILTVIEEHPEEYLTDTSYDADMPEPGVPLPVYDPEPDSPSLQESSEVPSLSQDQDYLVTQEKPKLKLKKQIVMLYERLANRFFRHNVRNDVTETTGVIRDPEVGSNPRPCENAQQTDVVRRITENLQDEEETVD